MASSDDCKRLLDHDPAVQAAGQGPWKRLSKRQAPDGVERLFQNKTGSCFVRVLETPSGLSVASVGASLADVDTARAATKRVSGMHPTVDSDPQHGEWAEQALQAAEAGEEAGLTAAQMASCGRALANRIVFGVAQNPEGFGDPTAVVVSFVPLDYWNRCRAIPDFELPIESLVPHPQASETPNGSGDWLVHGFDGDVRACIRALINQGFHWHADVQALVSQQFGDTSQDWVVEWVESGGEGGESALANTEALAAEVVRSDFSVLTEMADLHEALRTPEPLVLVFPASQEPVTERFWAELRVLQKALAGARVAVVDEGTPVAQAIEKTDGPAQGWRFAWFVRGQRLNADVEQMSLHLFEGLVRDFRMPGRPNRPR